MKPVIGGRVMNVCPHYCSLMLRLFISTICCTGVVTALELDRVFGDQMVLPMENPVPVWGSAEPGSEVVVSFSGLQHSTISGLDGAWLVELPRMKASSESRVLSVSSGEKRIEISDILIGEVWLCAGQSNMDFPLSRATGGRGEADAAGQYPLIRLLNMSGVHTSGRKYVGSERQRMHRDRFFQGGWRRASQESAHPFSAVGWWAGKEIHLAKEVPVGLIDCSVGGSGTEAWLPSEMLQARDSYAQLIGEGWMDSPRVSAWARGRAKLNLGGTMGAHPFQPGFLFDAGVRMWRGFPLAGVLWYQGETNAEIHDDEWNEQLLTDLVKGWRRVLEQPELHIFMVELPRIGGEDPMRQWWPQYRAVQARVTSRLDKVELIKTTDLGWDSPDVHPPDKRPVGERLGKAVVKAGR